MKSFPFSILAAVLAAAASAPAQFAIQARFGRHVDAAVVVGNARGYSHGHSRGGHWTTVNESYLVPGYWREVRVPPTYGWVRDHCGHRVWGVVDAGGCRREWVPERWETRCRRVWVSC